MAKKILATFIFIFVGLGIFYSCSKVDDDMQKPSVEILLPQENAVVSLASFYQFKAHFKDNDGLSSYIIRIWNPEVGKNRVIRDPNKTEADSLVYLDQIFQRVDIFGKTDIIVNHDFLLDTISSYKSSQHPTALGTYEFKVVVMDMQGNRDSSRFKIEVVSPIREVKK